MPVPQFEICYGEGGRDVSKVFITHLGTYCRGGGRPMWNSSHSEREGLGFANTISFTQDGHGGPPLQYVPSEQ